MNKGLCNEICKELMKPKKSPFYFWQYEDDDDGSRYKAYLEWLNDMENKAKELTCICKEKESLKKK